MTLIINVPLLLAILATGFSVIWLVFYARMNEGYAGPVVKALLFVLIVWITYSGMK